MRQPSIHKIFSSLTISAAIFFLVISGALLVTSEKLKDISHDLIGNKTLVVSTEQVIRLFATEIPLLDHNGIKDSGFSISQENGILKLFTMISRQPNEWLKQEIPVFSYVRIDNNKNMLDLPVENTPSPDFFLAEKNNSNQVVNKPNVPATTGDHNVVYIYHTHNRESFLPELQTKEINESFHPTKNITLVGQRLGEELQHLGVGTEVSTKDYWPDLDNYVLSYKYSLKSVQTALQQNKDIKYIFDIHRDAVPGGREKTTKTINGKDYGMIFFVIGAGNKNYEQNKEFAFKINDSLEKLYPGLSKGIIERQTTTWTNGEYNQSISPYALTIEIGGVFNTLEEEYRSAKALAEAIADVYWEAEKVDARPN